MNVKSILRAFWCATEDYGEDEFLSVRKVREAGETVFYTVETSGNRFDAAVHKNNPDVVFFRGEGIVGGWKTTEGIPAIDVDGIPYLPPMEERNLSPSDIAKRSGVSVATVYNIAKKLGRMPTIDEVKNRQLKKGGRPRKY